MTETESDSMNFSIESWTESDYEKLVEHLKSIADEKYKKFNSSLIPDENPDFMFGVRMPQLRALGKEISKGNANSFLKVSSNKHYEERMLKGIVVGLIKTDNFEEFVSLCNLAVADINNWALCDCFCGGLKQVKVYKEDFFEYIKNYLNSDDVWKIRVALIVMLNYYLEDEYIDRVFERCDRITSNYYYVNMAQAWLIATAFAKCEKQTRAYLLNNNLDKFTYNKTIQKCVESRRIDAETKLYLKSLKKS